MTALLIYSRTGFLISSTILLTLVSISSNPDLLNSFSIAFDLAALNLVTRSTSPKTILVNGISNEFRMVFTVRMHLSQTIFLISNLFGWVSFMCCKTNQMVFKVVRRQDNCM